MTDYTVTGNINYAAEVVRVERLVDLPGLDNLVGLPVSGYTALVSRSTQVGDVLVVFPAEAQLSHEFVSRNNLYADASLNADQNAKGYLGKNRRVKAIRLRGHTSSALALNASVVGNPEPGTTFDTIDGVQISRKYEVPVRAGATLSGKSVQEKVWKRVDEKFLPLHPDTENYWRNEHKIPDDTWVTVTQKIHGTSVRLGNTLVKRRLNWKDRLAQRFGVKVADTEYDYVFGSRKVIKDPHNPNQNHYYSSDVWGDFGKTVEHLIPSNVVVYGELVGWVGDAPIQKGYTYDVPRGEIHLYVYRVAVVAADGGVYDLSRPGVEEFCANRGFKVVPLLWQGFKRDFVAEDWLDKVYSKEYAQAVPLSDKGTVDEGVVVRAEGVIPYALKAKSPKFFEWESKVLDEGKEVLS